jgi:hypothetical protein
MNPEQAEADAAANVNALSPRVVGGEGVPTTNSVRVRRRYDVTWPTGRPRDMARAPKTVESGAWGQAQKW